MVHNDTENKNDKKRHTLESLRIMKSFHERMAGLMHYRLHLNGHAVDLSDAESLACLDSDDDGVDSGVEDLVEAHEPAGMVPRAGKGYPPPQPEKRARPVERAEAPHKRTKTTRSTKEDALEKSSKQFDRVMATFHLPESVVHVSADEYRLLLPKIQKNINGFPTPPAKPSKSLVINDVRTIKRAQFVPRDLTMRIFIDHINLATDKNSQSDKTCKACSQKIDDWFAVSLGCDRTKMHPKCAVIIINVVGVQAYHRCLTPLLTCNADGSLRSKHISCRHTEFKETYLEDTHRDALEMAMKR